MLLSHYNSNPLTSLPPPPASNFTVPCPFGTAAAIAVHNKSKTEMFGNLKPHFYLIWAPRKN